MMTSSDPYYDDYIVVRAHRPEPLDSDVLSLCDFWLTYTRDVEYIRQRLLASVAALVLALALLTCGCDATGLTVEQQQQTGDAPVDVPQAVQPRPARVAPPPVPVPPPVAVPAPLPVPVPPRAAPVQPPAPPEAPLPAPVTPPPVPPCFDRDLGDIAACAGRADCAASSTVTARTMCHAAGVTYVVTCETCEGVW